MQGFTSALTQQAQRQTRRLRDALRVDASSVRPLLVRAGPASARQAPPGMWTVAHSRSRGQGAEILVAFPPKGDSDAFERELAGAPDQRNGPISLSEVSRRSSEPR